MFGAEILFTFAVKDRILVMLLGSFPAAMTWKWPSVATLWTHDTKFIWALETCGDSIAVDA